MAVSTMVESGDNTKGSVFEAEGGGIVSFVGLAEAPKTPTTILRQPSSVLRNVSGTSRVSSITASGSEGKSARHPVRFANPSVVVQSSSPNRTGPKFVFEAFGRVFFQGRADLTERQIKPNHASSGTNVLDSHIYVCIDGRRQTLNLYPYKGSSSNQRGVPLIVDPIDLKYFDAEIMPHSTSDVGLYVRSNPLTLQHHPSANNAAAQDNNTTTTNAGLGEYVRRHTFRIEFRNEEVLQSPDRVWNKFNASRQKAAELSRRMGTMSNNVSNATKQVFSSHDDVEANRQLERQKLQDACGQYLEVVSGMRRHVSSTAKHFIKAANVVTITIPLSQRTTASPGNQQTPLASNIRPRSMEDGDMGNNPNMILEEDEDDLSSSDSESSVM